MGDCDPPPSRVHTRTGTRGGMQSHSMGITHQAIFHRSLPGPYGGSVESPMGTEILYSLQRSDIPWVCLP